MCVLCMFIKACDCYILWLSCNFSCWRLLSVLLKCLKSRFSVKQWMGKFRTGISWLAFIREVLVSLPRVSFRDFPELFPRKFWDSCDSQGCRLTLMLSQFPFYLTCLSVLQLALNNLCSWQGPKTMQCSCMCNTAFCGYAVWITTCGVKDGMWCDKHSLILWMQNSTSL